MRRLMPISAAICFLFLAGVWGCWDVDDEKKERIIDFFVVSVSDGMLNSQPLLSGYIYGCRQAQRVLLSGMVQRCGG